MGFTPEAQAILDQQDQFLQSKVEAYHKIKDQTLFTRDQLVAFFQEWEIVLPDQKPIVSRGDGEESIQLQNIRGYWYATNRAEFDQLLADILRR